MTDLAIRRAANGAIAIPPHLPMPHMPEKIARQLRDAAAFADARAAWQNAHPEAREDAFVGLAPHMPALIPSERREAETAAAALDTELRPVQPDVFRAWLGVVNAAVRNPQSREDFEVRALGMHALLDDLPAGCFTADARRSLPAFFPSAADIRAAVEPGANAMRRARSALAASLAPVTPQQAATPSVPAPRSQAEIDAVRASVRAFVATTRHDPAPAPLALRDKPLPLSQGALLAHYEALAAAGNEAAAFRAQIMRRQREDAR